MSVKKRRDCNRTPRWTFTHLDAAESAFLSHELEEIRSETFDIKYPEFIGRDLIPVNTNFDPGAEVLTYGQWDKVGMAKIIANYADDVPSADVLRNSFSQRVKGLGSKYCYSLQEIRAAKFARQPLDMKKAEAARRAIEQKIDQIAQLGDVSHDLRGLFNQANTNIYTVPLGAGASTTWALKTPDEIIKDINGILNGIVAATNGVEIPDTLILPIAQYSLITSTARSSTSDTTIAEFVLKSNPYLKAIVPWYALTGAGVGGTNRMIAYPRDARALELVITQEFEQLPPQVENYVTKVLCHARTAGVWVYYPMSISYGDGI